MCAADAILASIVLKIANGRIGLDMFGTVGCYDPVGSCRSIPRHALTCQHVIFGWWGPEFCCRIGGNIERAALSSL